MEDIEVEGTLYLLGTFSHLMDNENGKPDL